MTDCNIKVFRDTRTFIWGGLPFSHGRDVLTPGNSRKLRGRLSRQGRLESLPHKSCLPRTTENDCGEKIIVARNEATK